MFNLFGKSKSDELGEEVPGTLLSESKAKYSIQLDSKGKILFISFGLKEYFLIGKHLCNKSSLSLMVQGGKYH